MKYGRPNLNEGKEWSEMDLVDLRNSLALGRSVDYIAGGAGRRCFCMTGRDRRCWISHTA
jgi:hypothetical protein